MKKIILLGYMGSGKSVVAQLLAKKLDLPCFDLDQIITANAQTSISQIFETQGEIKFRKLEHEALQHIMRTSKSFVLSLGGGTPCYANNHEFLNAPHVISIYLRTSINVLHDRLVSEKQHRPLIAKMEGEDMKDFIAKSLFERSYYYNQAMYTIDTSNQSIEAVVAHIEKLLV